MADAGDHPPQFLREVRDEHEVGLMLSYAADEHWNVAPIDAHLYYISDPHGFMISTLDPVKPGPLTKDDIVSMISFVGYMFHDTVRAVESHTCGVVSSDFKSDAEYVHIGLYIVNPKYRRQGYGLPTFQKALQACTAKGARGMGLDAVPAQVANYRKLGFKDAFTFTGTVLSKKAALATASPPRSDGVSFRPVELSDAEALIAYDARVAGVQRGGFLHGLIAASSSITTWVAVDADNIIGYCCCRRGDIGWKCGPLYANNVDVAVDLMRHCLPHVDGDSITFEAANANENIAAFQERLGGGEAITVATRMFYGTAPSFDPHRLYSVYGLELY